MKFIYHVKAGESYLNIDDATFNHIFKARRTNYKDDNTFIFSNMMDDFIYTYVCKSTNTLKGKIRGKARDITFHLISKEEKIRDVFTSHLILSIHQDIYKILPALNELAVSKVTLFYSQYSQRNINLDIERMRQIILNSSMQCNRRSIMNLEILDINTIKNTYKNIILLDINSTNNIHKLDIKGTSLMIGPEGGFSKEEREEFNSANINHPLILRSTTAAIFCATLFIK